MPEDASNDGKSRLPSTTLLLQDQRKPTHRRRIMVILAVLAAVGALVMIRISRERADAELAAKKAAPHPIPVRSAASRVGDMGVYLRALGTVTPLHTVSITSRVQGQIMSVSYEEGQLVHKGSPLVEIDPRPYAAALIQAEGQLARDEATLEQARIDLKRYRKAYARNAIPRQQLDDQEQLVLQLRGAVKADQGALENARVNLVYCHLTSPIEGRVGLRLVDPGNIVQPNSPTTLLVVTELKPITVIFSVAEDHLPQIQAHLSRQSPLRVEVYDRAQDKLLAVGAFQTLDNLIDPTTGTVKIRAIFGNEKETLFPNQFVNARLLVQTEHGVTLVPTPAIQRSTQGTFVYVIDQSHTAHMRKIKAGNANSDETVVEGVKAGELVATSGFDKLQDNTKVSEIAPTRGVATQAPEKGK